MSKFIKLTSYDDKDLFIKTDDIRFFEETETLDYETNNIIQLTNIKVNNEYMSVKESPKEIHEIILDATETKIRELKAEIRYAYKKGERFQPYYVASLKDGDHVGIRLNSGLYQAQILDKSKNLVIFKHNGQKTNVEDYMYEIPEIEDV